MLDMVVVRCREAQQDEGVSLELAEELEEGGSGSRGSGGKERIPKEGCKNGRTFDKSGRETDGSVLGSRGRYSSRWEEG